MENLSSSTKIKKKKKYFDPVYNTVWVLTSGYAYFLTRKIYPPICIYSVQYTTINSHLPTSKHFYTPVALVVYYTIYTVRKVSADFAVCDWWRYCKVSSSRDNPYHPLCLLMNTIRSHPRSQLGLHRLGLTSWVVLKVFRICFTRGEWPDPRASAHAELFVLYYV